MMNFSLIDVKSITSEVPRSNFTEADLESLADIILESGGIIKPLVVKQIDHENYTLIDGHLEYYAAVRAREKNPRKGEMVNAFVISPKIEDLITKQVSVLKEIESPVIDIRPQPDTTKLEPRLANIELRLERQVNEFKSELAQERHRIEDRLKHIESQMPKKITPLEVFNTLDLSDLTLRLINASFSEQLANKVAKSIYETRKKKKFESLSDVVERVKITSGKRQIKGITSDKMVIILDSWSRTLFV